MQEITILDKTFSLYLSEAEIAGAIDRVSALVAHDYKDAKPVFVVVLSGAFMFASELLKRVDIPAEVTFIRVKSYDGMQTTGAMHSILGLDMDIKGRAVVVLEDIVDTGLTMKHVVEQLYGAGAASVDICALFHKPAAQKTNVIVKYAAMKIPNDFIVGFGLDYDGYGRNLAGVYKLKQ